MVACLNRPNFEAMPCKQFVDQVRRCDKTKPEHKTGRCTSSCGHASHYVEHESYEHSLNKCGDNSKDIDHRIGIAWLPRHSYASPPSCEEHLGVIPHEPADHTDHHTSNNS